MHEDVLCPRANHAKLTELEEGVSEENWRRSSDKVAARRPAWKQHLREGHSRRRFQKRDKEKRRKGWRGKGYTVKFKWQKIMKERHFAWRFAIIYISYTLLGNFHEIQRQWPRTGMETGEK